MVIGNVARNGILRLDADQRFRAEGYSAFDAMIEAGERRLRPILMTALRYDGRHDSVVAGAGGRRCCNRWPSQLLAAWLHRWCFCTGPPETHKALRTANLQPAGGQGSLETPEPDEAIHYLFQF